MTTKAQRTNKAVAERMNLHLEKKKCPDCGHEPHRFPCAEITGAAPSGLGTSFVSVRRCKCPGKEATP